MRIHKIAQLNEEVKVKQAFDEARELMDRGVVRRDNNGIPMSFEIRDEASPTGTRYIQLYYLNGILKIETYYESEMAQQEYGESHVLKIDMSKNIAEQIANEINEITRG